MSYYDFEEADDEVFYTPQISNPVNSQNYEFLIEAKILLEDYGKNTGVPLFDGDFSVEDLQLFLGRFNSKFKKL